MLALAMARLRSPIARWELPLLFCLLLMQLGGLIAMAALAFLRVLAGSPVDFWGLYVALGWFVAFMALVPLFWKLGKNREALRAEGRLWVTREARTAR